MIQPFVKTGATLAHEFFCQLLRSRLRFWRSTGLAPVVRMLRKSQKVAAVWLCLVPSSHWYWLPSGYVKIAIEHGPFIVDLRIYLSKMVIFHGFLYVYQAGYVDSEVSAACALKSCPASTSSNLVILLSSLSTGGMVWHDITLTSHDMIFSNGMLMYVSMIPLNSIVMQIWNTWNWS